MELLEIYIYGKYNKKMSLCNREEKIYECDSFALEFKNGSSISAIAHIDKNGYYFNILALYKNGKIYRNFRFHKKYVAIVRDNIFEYYKKLNKVEF